MFLSCLRKTVSMEQNPFWGAKGPLGSSQEISPHFVQSDGSLLRSHSSATCPWPEPEQSSLCPHLTSWRSTLILFPIYAYVSQVLFFCLMYHAPHLVSIFHWCYTKGSVLSPRPCVLFRNVGSYDELLVAPRSNPKLEDHPLSAVRDCLLYTFASTSISGNRFSNRNPRTRHSVVTVGCSLSLHIFSRFYWDSS